MLAGFADLGAVDAAFSFQTAKNIFRSSLAELFTGAASAAGIIRTGAIAAIIAACAFAFTAWNAGRLADFIDAFKTGFAIGFIKACLALARWVVGQQIAT